MSDSRDAILSAVRARRPSGTPLPEAQPPALLADSGEADFIAVIESIGGRVERVDRARMSEAFARAFPVARVVASTVDEIAGTVDFSTAQAPVDLAGIDVLVCEGEVGVVENGAVWLGERRMGHRAAPFLAQHLVLVLDRRRLVADMHAAYAAVPIEEAGFGAFIAGPSKTADIEQSLVLGAHGPRSMLVLLV